MDANELIEDLRKELQGLKAAGKRSVDIGGLEQYLAYMAGRVDGKAPSPGESSEQRRAREAWDRYAVTAPMEHSARMEVYRSVLGSGEGALRSLLFVNGGAAVALLAFAGNVLSKSPPPPISIREATWAMLAFVAGVAMAVLGHGGRYFAQAQYSNDNKKAGDLLNMATILLGFASLAAFGLGGILAFYAVSPDY